jgi:hypothetical protein
MPAPDPPINPQVLDWLEGRWVADELFELTKEFRYDTAINGGARIIVPAGFTTDFASVPRLPLAYMVFGNKAHMAAVVHDYLYTTGIWPKDQADLVFREAMLATGIKPWQAEQMYAAVRDFGESAWEGHGNTPAES